VVVAAAVVVVGAAVVVVAAAVVVVGAAVVVVGAAVVVVGAAAMQITHRTIKQHYANVNFQFRYFSYLARCTIVFSLPHFSPEILR